MGLFSKKPNQSQQVVEAYIAAARPWCARLNEARDEGIDVATRVAIVRVAGDLPKLDTQRIDLQSRRDEAIATARAWLSAETDRLSRQDVLQGRSTDFWTEVGGILYSDLPQPSYR